MGTVRYRTNQIYSKELGHIVLYSNLVLVLDRTVVVIIVLTYVRTYVGVGKFEDFVGTCHTTTVLLYVHIDSTLTLTDLTRTSYKSNHQLSS